MASAEGSRPEGGPLMDPHGANGKSQKTPRPEGKKGAPLPPGQRGCGAAPPGDRLLGSWMAPHTAAVPGGYPGAGTLE